MKRYADLYDRALTTICLLPAGIAWYYYATPIQELIMLALLLIWIAFTEWPRLFSPRSFAFWLVFPFYPTLSFILSGILLYNPVYRPLLPFVILLTFTYDAGGYFIGKAIGKHPLLPALSPNKTVEGALAGIIAAFITCIFYKGTYEPLYLLKALGITLCICVCACAGDLFESFLKRRAGIKDTGTILPGNGGFLDRIDALLFVTLFTYVARNYLLAYLS